MIVFPCKACGKHLRQADEAAGSLLFCSCGQANRVPWESTVDPSEAPEAERRRRRSSRRRVDPNRCLTHEDQEATRSCADCEESFCDRCLVLLQGAVLCGPCKNHRLRLLQKPVPTSGLAVTALLVGLLGAPVLFCTTLAPVGEGASDGGRIAAALVGMVIPIAALVLGLLALRQIEGRTGQGGRGLAMTGAICGVAGVLWSLSIIVSLCLQIVRD